MRQERSHETLTHPPGNGLVQCKENMDHTVPYASNSHLMAVVSLVSAAVSSPVGPTLLLLSFIFSLPAFPDEELVGLLLCLDSSQTG